MLPWTYGYTSVFSQVSALNYLGYMLRSGIAKSYGFCRATVLIVFLQWLLHYISHQQCTRVPVSPHSHQHSFSFLLSFFIITLLIGVKWNCLVVLICISLMITDVKHLCMCLLTTWYFLQRNVYSSPLSSFELGCFFKKNLCCIVEVIFSCHF